jgi:glycosyltransferase involved in cell wall biosynthesis
MRIAHVDAETGFSGGEVQVFLLMEGLRALGHEGVLVCPPGSEAERQARRCGFEVECVRMRGDLDLSGVQGLCRVLQRSRVELVHLHTSRATWLGGIAARLSRLPAITTRRMDRRLPRGLRTRAIYRGLVRRVVGISPAVCERLRRGGVPETSIVLIQSSVDPEQLRSSRRREELREELGAGADDVVGLVLASLVHRKGIDVLLEALARQPAEPVLRLWIAGDGPERARLEQLARARGLERQVRFLGQRDDKNDLLAACDLFLMPSRAEGLGVAALEAMAMGRPVVAGRVGGLADLVLDGVTGRLVSPGDVDALASVVRSLVGAAGERDRLGAAGPARVADGFLASQMVAAYERLYSEVLAEMGSR